MKRGLLAAMLLCGMLAAAMGQMTPEEAQRKLDEASVKAAAQDIPKLKAEIAALKAERDKLRGEVEALRKEHAAMAADITAAKRHAELAATPAEQARDREQEARVAAAIGEKRLLRGMSRAQALKALGPPNDTQTDGEGIERLYWNLTKEVRVPSRAPVRSAPASSRFLTGVTQAGRESRTETEVREIGRIIAYLRDGAVVNFEEQRTGG